MRELLWVGLPSFALVLTVLLPSAGLAQQDDLPVAFGEIVSVRTGVVRITLPEGTPPPRPEDVEVVWKRKPQPVLRVVGGQDEPIELGIAVDLSASLHGFFVPMRDTALRLVDELVAPEDHLFVVAFADRAERIAADQSDARTVLAAIPGQPASGTRGTGLFDAIGFALDQFTAHEGRAALLVATDGCNTLHESQTSVSVAARAEELAIPVFLLMPDRGRCRRVICESDGAGGWACRSAGSPPTTTTMRPVRPLSDASLSGQRRTTTVSEHTPSIIDPTAARADLLHRLERQGGGELLVTEPEAWHSAFEDVMATLARQWAIVFEPTGDEVDSRDVKVYLRVDGKRRRVH